MELSGSACAEEIAKTFAFKLVANKQIEMFSFYNIAKFCNNRNYLQLESRYFGKIHMKVY